MATADRPNSEEDLFANHLHEETAPEQQHSWTVIENDRQHRCLHDREHCRDRRSVVMQHRGILEPMTVHASAPVDADGYDHQNDKYHRGDRGLPGTDFGTIE